MTLDRNAYELANLVDVSCPDTPDSPGAQFLLGVQHDVQEALNGAYGKDFEPSDVAHEIADNAVPVYTYEKWQTFVDLAAWQEDLEEFASGDSLDLDDASNLALYIIARRLAELLFEEAANEAETAAILADEETMAAIAEAEEEDS